MNCECKRFSLQRSCAELIQVDRGWLRAREAGGRMEQCLAPHKLLELVKSSRYVPLVRISFWNKNVPHFQTFYFSYFENSPVSVCFVDTLAYDSKFHWYFTVNFYVHYHRNGLWTFHGHALYPRDIKVVNNYKNIISHNYNVSYEHKK